MKQIPAFYFSEQKLRLREAKLKKSFLSADPFPFFKADDFLPKPILKTLIHEFPGPRNKAWKKSGPGRTWNDPAAGEKLSISLEEDFGPFTRHFLAQLNSTTFLQHLERVTGVANLLPDPRYTGGGLHSTGQGGRLMIRTDQNRHISRNPLLHQVLNGILYLNEDWSEEYGGQLELWDSKRVCKQKITPIANRFVLFSTGTKTLHGHPSRVACPKNRRRNSIAIYYYILQRPESEDYTGYQESVNWVPSSAADQLYSAAVGDRMKQWVSRHHGKTIPPREGLNKPLFIFDEKKLSAGEQGQIKADNQLVPFGAADVKQFSAEAEMFFYDGEGRIMKRTASGRLHFVLFAERLLAE